jgi:peptide methionine sulfoxide reductase msrA/msrB
MKRLLIYITLIIFAVGCQGADSSQQGGKKIMPVTKSSVNTATFAGGCFWCVESDFEKVPGVVKVISGYSGGAQDNPTYETYGEKGYIEAVQVYYDPSQVTYEQLLDVFWKHIDPTDPDGQFGDRGRQYRSAIFYHNEEQKRSATHSQAALNKSGRFQKPVVTEIIKFTKFYEAEAYHQNYYKVNPLRYQYYRQG